MANELEDSHVSTILKRTHGYYGDDSQQNLRQVQEFEREVEDSLNKTDQQILRLEQKVDELTTLVLQLQALHP